MRHHLRGSIVIAGALVALFWGMAPAGEELHGCPDAHGNLVYQDDPCVDTPAVAPVRPKAAAAPKRAGLPKAASLRTVEPPRTRPASPTAPVRNTPYDGSVVRTWQTFVAAVKEGDRAGALGCLTPSAATALEPASVPFPSQGMRETVLSATRVVDEGELGPFRSLRVLRGDGRPKWVLFERTSAGAWKIAAM